VWAEPWELAISVCCCVPQVEKQKNELNRELEDLRDKLEEEGGVKTAQVRKQILFLYLNLAVQ
jgi:hypothetical protein